MVKSYKLIAVILILNACGGGSDDANNFSSPISGRWTGQLYQNGGVFCSDGQFLGVGLGVPTSVASISISGGDSVASQILLNDGNCQYIGQRDLESSVTLLPTQENCGDAVIIADINSDGFQYTTDPSAPKPDSHNGTTCTISETGILIREK